MEVEEARPPPPPRLSRRNRSRQIMSSNQSVITSFVLFAIFIQSCGAIKLISHFSQHGVSGTVTFHAATSGGDLDGKTVVTVRLNVAEEYAGEYSWGVYQFPIDYSVSDYCHSRMLGRRPMVSFDETLGKLVLPTQPLEEGAAHDGVVEFATDAVVLEGPDSIWGRSLVLEGPSKTRVCATIFPAEAPTKTAEARFAAPVAGSVWFTSVSKGDAVETKIMSNLYHTGDNSKSTQHNWRLYISDALASSSDLQGNNCDFLQILYDPKHKDGQDCSEKNPGKCREGDLGGKFGQVRVGKQESMFTKSYHTDLNLELPELEGTRSLFLVLYDPDHPDSFLSCAKVREIKTKVSRAKFSDQGITGKIEFSQKSPFQPVVTSIDLKGLDGRTGGFHVHQYPVPPKQSADDNPCLRTRGHYNPFRVDASVSPPAGQGTFDKYEVGDLSGKYGSLKDKNNVVGRFVDPNLALFGPQSIERRSIVIHATPKPTRLTCANIGNADKPEITAVAQFTYPVAGRIVFRQDADDAFADTTVFVESLLYSDGTKNYTRDHRWQVHVEQPGRDYFNWTGRCLSTGEQYNPYAVGIENYNDCLNEHKPFRCQLGDLANKLGTIEVSGRKMDILKTMRYFTDSNLPLSGPTSIIGHSLVLLDDHAPEHRGDRMACTLIQNHVRHKAVVTDWFGNGVTPPPVSGRMEFIQNLANSETHTLVDLKTLNGVANAYHVHVIPVQERLEFPCTGEAVGGHFNPYKFDKSSSPKPGTGTPDQYEIGDLSGKYGLLGGKHEYRGIHNDTNLPLYGKNSIVGRSIVVHKKHKAERWACASIGWGFDPDEATEIRAIASFHHPNGFAWGYVRLRQVVYRDGSSTDTTVEVRLKYPGKTNNERTGGHDWSVYVNPVGHDAAVKFYNARCSAAGYRWNPTLIQLADPKDTNYYAQECGPDYPLRCEVGDMSGKHGRIEVGAKAFVFNDPNLPLSGDWYQSALGKSIVVLTPDGGGERMACANIEEEKNIVKQASILTKSGFNLATFMEEVRAVMGVPDWFLYLDSRRTRRVHGGKCVQIKIHFAGPQANRLEQDFARLLRTGKLAQPSIYIPGYVPPVERKTSLGYRECGSSDKKQSSSKSSSIRDLYNSLTGGGGGHSSASHLTSSTSSFLLLVSFSLLFWMRR